MEEYLAHINEATGETQTVKDHCENTADLCMEYGIPQMKDVLYATGILHDVGKYQSTFQKRIRGQNIRIEHSVCGVLVAMKTYHTAIAYLMGYCIAGHHSGIPDGGRITDQEYDSTLAGRIKRTVEDYSFYKNDLILPKIDSVGVGQYLAEDCGGEMKNMVDKFAFFTRYIFSCLVDADSTDTALFCRNDSLPRPLKSNFEKCFEKVDRKLNSFRCETELQKARSVLQSQAFKNSRKDGEIYLLNMPTGSGKTLASVKIALERAIRKGKKRIIYIIPFNSIIEQTAEEFDRLFGEDAEILRHQSTYSYEMDENISEDYKLAARAATENWSSDFIITTAVQFFESIYSNKRGKLRKMHNMSDSILIFDEAHLMPEDYLQPCLQALSYITKYLNSEAVLMTATMPDFEYLIRRYALSGSKIVSLVTDTSKFSEFQKCKYTYVGEVSEEELLKMECEAPSRLFIVNSKKEARKLYEMCTNEMLEGKHYHLSTYLTPLDRKRILAEIREELKSLERDFPEQSVVPKERRITIISTSLIEAGVDLDVYTVFRETAGLDSILQSGGRCNREGRREKGTVFLFDLILEGRREKVTGIKNGIARAMLKEGREISQPECIKDYYQTLFYEKESSDVIERNTIHQECSDIRFIPFKTYAEKFELISDSHRNVSIIVAEDEISMKEVEILKYSGGKNIRKLQNYAATISKKDLDELIRQHAADDFGTGIFCLTNRDYYDSNKGVLFEGTDYII